MIEKPTEPLYKKVGRKYIPVAAYWHERHDADQMTVGTFRLTYAHADGGRRYEYSVEPATAPTMAAMMIAKKAMEDAMREAAKMRPGGGRPFSKTQLATIERFRAEMGGLFPSWWTENAAHEIAEAGIRAVMEFKP